MICPFSGLYYFIRGAITYQISQTLSLNGDSKVKITRIISQGLIIHGKLTCVLSTRKAGIFFFFKVWVDTFLNHHRKKI